MAISRKKAIVRMLSQDSSVQPPQNWLAGYLPSIDFLTDGMVELLALDGKTLRLDAVGLKWICYVRDFNSGDAAHPERLLRKTFTGRPRTEGLLLRLHLTDGDLIEGLAANDLTLASGEGLFLTPPDVRSNTQRLWIPPTAIAQLEVIAVIGGTKRKQQSAAPSAQERLF